MVDDDIMDYLATIKSTVKRLTEEENKRRAKVLIAWKRRMLKDLGDDLDEMEDDVDE